jgi:hypothetical protein
MQMDGDMLINYIISLDHFDIVNISSDIVVILLHLKRGWLLRVGIVLSCNTQFSSYL